MTRLDAAIQLWSDPRILIVTAVIFGAVFGAAVGEYRERRR